MKTSRDIVLPPKVVALARQKRLRKRRRTILWGIFSILCIFFLAWISTLEALAIRTIEVSGNVVIPESRLVEHVEKKLEGKYIHLFSKRNSFIYPKRTVTESMTEEFSRIRTLEVSRKNLHTLSIRITEEAGKYLWCGEKFTGLKQVAPCYYVNNQGEIFAEAPFFSGNIYFKFFTPLVGDSPKAPIGNTISASEGFHTYIEFMDSVQALDLPLAGFVTVSDTENNIVLYGKNTTELPRIRFSSDADLVQVANDLALVLKTEAFAGDREDILSRLDYIDLRFENKAYYKFKVAGF